MFKIIINGIFSLVFLPIYLFLSFYLCWRHWLPRDKRYYNSYGTDYIDEIMKPTYWNSWKCEVVDVLFIENFSLFKF